MLKSPIAVAILAALQLVVAANAYADTTTSSTDQTTTTQSQSSTPSQDTTQSSNSDESSSDTSTTKTKNLNTVIVSGSLINNAQIQTATPTFTITAEEIQARAFTSVAEVLQNSVFATGSIPGSQTPGFNQGSQTFSFYGLNPEYTLTLIDGKPITQFGQLYGGQSDFTNISNIPISIVDHIDVLPGGGSSIYGSQAISGVVNIVTKDHVDGVNVSVRTGNYSDGGGANQRLSASFGHQFGKLSVVGAVEFDSQAPTWYHQRDFTKDSPHPDVVAAIWDYGTGNNGVQGFLSPPNGCGAMSGLFAGTTVQTSSRTPGTTGTYCGSREMLSYGTMINQSRSYDTMLKLRYDLNDNVRLYADATFDWQQQKFTAGSDFSWWGPNDMPGGEIEDATTRQVLYPERIFAPEEVGGNNTGELLRQDDLMYQADIGANGTFGDSGWNWDVYYLRSGDRTTDLSPLHPAAAMDGYFNAILGPVVGVDPANGLNMYHPNYAAFFTPLTPAQYASFTMNVNALYNAWINNTRGTVSNDSLFKLPGGDAGFAWLVEAGNQAWYNPVNPQLDLWGNAGVSGGGQRDHAASAFQLNLPVLPQVTIDLSGRFDRYTVNQGASNNKFTFKSGIEYRPFGTLLIRGNYATGFIAPDMSAVFLGPSDQYNQVTDYYLCATQGHNQNCQENYIDHVVVDMLPNKNLQPTTSKSWTVGTVWAPIHNLSLSADFLHIAIVDEIDPQSTDILMRQEAQCRLGQLPTDSALCQAAYAQITRSPYNDQVTNVTTYYVNIANEVTDSVTAEAKYTFDPTRIGTFGVQLDYNDMLKHQYQEYPGTMPINLLSNPLWSTEFKDIASGALSWSWHDTWGSTLYWHRYSPSPNYIAMTDGPGYPGAGRVAPWITYNWSLHYSPIKDLKLSLMINNVFNKMPPNDPTYTAFPYFNAYNYNVYGREIMLQADYHFGGGS